MLFVSRCSASRSVVDSRRRFNLGIEMLFVSRKTKKQIKRMTGKCFNIGIEMLFVSSDDSGARVEPSDLVSISESRCFSFQVITEFEFCFPIGTVSISESRCFSFQVTIREQGLNHLTWFQSRNRDAFRFKGIPQTPSERCSRRFNLGIEMLFVSSTPILKP